MSDAEHVRTFYDTFAATRMQTYRREDNERLRRATARLLNVVDRDSLVLEVGCGIGLVTERIAATASAGFVWACDISARAIAEARERVTAKNVEFRVLDVVDQRGELRAWLPRPVHVVAMVDVVEHLPLASHPALFETLRRLVDDEAFVVLTYPSPQYQRYLHAHQPEELQVIDETVEATHVARLAHDAGFEIRHFSLEDVWLTNQYVHCVLQTPRGIGPTPFTSARAASARRAADAVAELRCHVTGEQPFILVDDGQFDAGRDAGAIPFLERDGELWGSPADDAQAIRELERLRASGAAFVVVGWPAFWWLDHYADFARHLRSRYRCLVDNEQLVIFDLRAEPRAAGPRTGMR